MGSSIYQMGYQSSLGRDGYGGAASCSSWTRSRRRSNEVRTPRAGPARPRRRATSAPTRSSAWRRARAKARLGARRQLALEHVVLGTAVRRDDGAAAPIVRDRPARADRAVGRRLRDAAAGRHRAARDRRVELGVLRELRPTAACSAAGPMTMGSMQNFELREFTQASTARARRSMEQITGQAAALGASGVVGVRIGHTRSRTRSAAAWAGRSAAGGRELRGMMVTFNAIGTAIRQHADASRPGARNRQSTCSPDNGATTTQGATMNESTRPRTTRPRWRASPRRAAPAWQQNRAGPVHVRSVGQRVPAGQAGGLRAARPGGGQLDLPHRHPGRGLEEKPGDDGALGGDVRRAPAGDDAHGGGGRPARRRRRRGRAPGHRPLRVGPGHGGVHRDRHRGQAPRRRAAPRAQRPARSRATSRARTSGRCCAPATARSGW